MEETRKVVEALMRVGPHFSEISRVTGVPISTVRYILLKKFPKLGLTIRASINYGALGLQRYLVEFKSDYPCHHISKILDLLGESMYLDYYTYSMTGKKFYAVFAIPLSYEKEFLSFLRVIQSIGLISDMDVRKLTYMRPLPFMTEFFDFSRGVWLQDWINKSKSRDVKEIPEYPDPHPKIDRIDLMLIAELQESVIPIKYSALAQKLRLTRQTISKHYKHVKKFINFFTIFWVPHMDPQLFVLPLIIKVKARKEFRDILLRVPFTHAEFRTDKGEYFAMLIIPNVGLYTTLKFLTNSIEIIEMNVQDMEYSGKFTIQYNLFKDGAWINVFDKAVERLIETVHASKKA